MIASTEHKDYQKLMKNGKGSILKALRADKGGGKGLITAGIVLLVAGLLLSMFGGLLFFGIPAVVLLAIGFPLKHKRESAWLSYYEEQTGFSESELLQIDRELASPTVTLVLTSGKSTNNAIACFFTQHYLVMNGVKPYVRRLEDFIAVAFSDSTDIWSMASLTKQDKETQAVGLFTDTAEKAVLCREITQELYRRNPNVLCGQVIACDGKNYILDRDGAELLRLYQQGHPLSLAE